MIWVRTVLTVFILSALIGSAFYSIRYRRQTDPALRGLFAARMNICMGAMLLGIAAIQTATFAMSTGRLILAVLFALIGLYNLFAGIRNHSYFRVLKTKEPTEMETVRK